MDDRYYMNEAIKEAKKSVETGDFPIGTVIILNGEIIARGRNQTYSLKDRLAHAEILALMEGREVLEDNRGRAKLYSTYEPCPMCLGASLLYIINQIITGINVDRSGAVNLVEHFPDIFKQDRYVINFKSGILARECLEVFMKGRPTQTLIREGLIDMEEVDRILRS